MVKIVVLDPVAEARPVHAPLSARPDTLSGKRIGFLDNTKANATELMRALEARLRSRYTVVSVLHKTKPLAAVGASEAVLEELARDCDVAIVAIGD